MTKITYKIVDLKSKKNKYIKTIKNKDYCCIVEVEKSGKRGYILITNKKISIDVPSNVFQIDIGKDIVKEFILNEL